MLRTGALYEDLGPDFYQRRDPDRARRRAMADLKALGYDVTLTPTGAA